MKKITFVINYFYPDVASTGQLLTELCKDIQDDFNLTVIAAQPGYDGNGEHQKAIFQESMLEKIKVIRIKLPKVNKNSKFSRLKYIISYFILANIALIKEKNTDMIYTISQPPILGGLIGTIGKFFKKCKHVYNIQDFNPEQAKVVGFIKRKSIFKIATAIDNLNCKYSDCVILVGNDMKETLKKRFSKEGGIPRNIVINNWTDEKDIIPLSKENEGVKKFIKRNNLEGKFIVMYSGNLGLYYDLENIIKITEKFREEKNLAFVFIGEGAMKTSMQEFVQSKELENVYFLPYQPKEEIKYSLNAADIHLVVNQKGIKGVSVPSKIYGVMAAGKPILGVLEKGSEAERLIKESDSGLIVEPQDYEGIANAISKFCNESNEILENTGRSGRGYLEANLKRELSIRKYKEIFNEILE